MRIRGSELAKEKKHRQRFGIPKSWTVWFLVIVELVLISQATAAPVIINEEGSGSWSDNFEDEVGIEVCDNVTVDNGCVTLLSKDDETSWIKKGVAVENRGYYDFCFAKNANVIIDEGIYKMWYAGWNGRNVRILHATSIDGVNWIKSPFNPVVDLGFPGDPDDTHVDVPKVIKDGGMYKMWYSGNDSICDRLMYATSLDGINWTKYGVVLSEEGVRPNTVIKDGAVYKMWYQNCFGDHWRIYYATSTDGISWTNHGLVLDVGSPGQLDDKHVSGAAVVKEDDGTYKMWYSGHDNETGYKIFYATGYDEMNWTKYGVVIEPGVVGEKEEAQTAYPNVIKGDDGIYKMWYNGPVNGYDVSIMYAVSQPSITERGNIVSIKIPLPPGQSWKDLIIDKTEAEIGNSLYVSILDGETNETIPGYESLKGMIVDLSSIDNITHPTIKLQATFIGDGSATPVLHGWKVTWLDTATITTLPNPPVATDNNLWAVAIIAVATGIALPSLLLAGGTEVGNYRFIPLFFPLYSRLKKEEVLDQHTRSMIYLYIMEHPGDHYNCIKNELQLNNGVLAYHLKTLEEHKYIKSMRDGIYKRFYPVEVKVPRVNGFGLDSTQGRIITLIVNIHGLTQRDISLSLNTSQQVVSYHLTQMMDSGHIRAERRGKTYRYFANEFLPRTNM